MKEDKIIEDVWKARHPYDVLFLELIDGYEIKIFDNYHFYIKNDIILIEYDKKRNKIFVNSYIIDIVFNIKTIDTLVDDKKKNKIMDILNIHLKIDEIPINQLFTRNGWIMGTHYVALKRISCLK